MRGSFYRRALAFTLDLAIAVAILTLARSIMSPEYNEMVQSLDLTTANGVLQLIFAINLSLELSLPVALLATLIYSVLTMVFIFPGQTLGKKVFKLRVATNDGKVPNHAQLVVRGIFQMPTLMYLLIFLATILSSMLVFMTLFGLSIIGYII